MSTLGELATASLDELTPTGLTAMMVHIAVNSPEGRAGAPASAVGVTAKTWNRWLSWARGAPGGSEPNARSRGLIARAARRATAEVWRQRRPTRAVIRASVKWNGYFNRQRERTTTLTNLDLGPMIDAYAAGDTRAVGAALRAAIRDRYGVPVVFYAPKGVEIS